MAASAAARSAMNSGEPGCPLSRRPVARWYQYSSLLPSRRILYVRNTPLILARTTTLSPLIERVSFASHRHHDPAYLVHSSFKKAAVIFAPGQCGARILPSASRPIEATY